MRDLKFIWKGMAWVAIFVAVVYGVIFLCAGKIPEARADKLFSGQVPGNLSPYLGFIAGITSSIWNHMPESLPRLLDIVVLPIGLFLILKIFDKVDDLNDNEIIRQVDENKRSGWDTTEFLAPTGSGIGAGIFLAILLIVIIAGRGTTDRNSLLLAEPIAFSLIMFATAVCWRMGWRMSGVLFSACSFVLCAYLVAGLFGGSILGGIYVVIALLPSAIIFFLAGLLIGSLLKVLRIKHAD